MDEEVLITINGIDIYKNDYIYASHSANFIAKTKVKLIEVKDVDILSYLKAERFLGLSGNPLNVSTG